MAQRTWLVCSVQSGPRAEDYHVNGGWRPDQEVSAMLAALVLLLGAALVVGWEIFCLGQVLLAERVRLLPRWAWAAGCLIFIPLGGIVYLLAGRVWTRAA